MLLHISLIFYVIGPDWLLIDLVFNSELAGIDDHVLGIVAPQCQWNMVVHLKDNLMVFAFCFLFCVYFSSYASK